MSQNVTFDPNSLIDFTVNDPPYVDAEFPFEQFVTHFISQESVVHATVWLAQGPALKGTVILSPQMFGGDRLESLIIPLMSSGINVLTFHPRGMWDNQHVYSIVSATEDALAAAEYVRSAASGDLRSPRGNAWRVDPERIAMLGLSGGGGNVGLTVCAEDPSVIAVIAIAPNSMVGTNKPGYSLEKRSMFELTKRNTANRIDMEAIMARVTAEEFDRIDPLKQGARLREKNVLLVGALRDVVSPIDTNHVVIANAFREAGAARLTDVIMETDHAFLSKRIALARLVVGWLKQQCGF